MAEWPEFPDVEVEVGEGKVVMAEEDRVRIVVWLDQVHRIRESLKACEQVIWVPPPQELKPDILDVPWHIDY